MPKARTKSNKDKDESGEPKKSNKSKKATAATTLTTITVDEALDSSELKDDQHQHANAAFSHEIGLNSTSDLLNKQEPLDQTHEQPVEIKYEEPVLTSIVVDR